LSRPTFSFNPTEIGPDALEKNQASHHIGRPNPAKEGGMKKIEERARRDPERGRKREEANLT